MANDFEALAQAFLNGKRPQNLDAVKSMLATEENKKLLSSVADGAVLKRALSDAQRGKTDLAKSLVESLAKAPGGSELITKILRTVEGQK